MIRKVFKFILIVIWMGFIYSLSGDSGEESDGLSSKIIVNVVEMVKGRELSDYEKKVWTNRLSFPIRKLAHMFIYFVLSIFIYSFIREFNLVNSKTIILSIILSLLYACSDEIHQLFINGRSGQILDVFIDMIGVFIGIFLYYLVRVKKHE